MQRLVLALEGVLQRRQKLVLAVWAVALLAAVPLAAQQEEKLTGGGFEATASESGHVERAIRQHFPNLRSTVLVIALVPREGARPADLAAAAQNAQRSIAEFDGVRLGRGAGPLLRQATAVPPTPGRALPLPLEVDKDESRATDAGRELREALGIEGAKAATLADGRVGIHVVGQGALWAAFQEQSKTDAQQAEARAFPLIAIILLVAFGSLAAAALPTALGVAVVTLSGAIIYLLSLQIEMSVFVVNIASMIGLGVAVDYSLFVLARYREEIAAGRSEQQARARALATSGVAVAFSGLTVVAALSGLFLIEAAGLRSLAIGAIIVVSAAVLGASTLLPVLITMLGRRVYEPGRLGKALARRRAVRPAKASLWHRWTTRVMRRPVLSALSASAVLLALAAPAVDLRLGNSALRQLKDDHEIHDGVRAVAATTGPGSLGPVRVLVTVNQGDIHTAENRAAVTAVTAAARRDPAVERVRGRRIADDERSVAITVLLRADPESDAAREAVRRLRETLPAVGHRAEVEIGGTTAVLIDFDDLVADSMWKIMFFVLALSFLVLVVLLRSLLLPLKAVLMNVLSVLAAYGVLVAVFQWGWLEFLGLDSRPMVDTITPPLVLAVAFGLSMDYEIFLLTRIRERYMATGDTRLAVAEGLESSARTITSAALIMVAVFLAFVTAGAPAVQRIGLATAVALAVDATIVRLILVPATMQMLGRWNWWLPRPLARVLPPPSFEQVGVAVESTGKR